jgi:hypothetical protein
MATRIATASRFSTIVVHPKSEGGEIYRRARAAGFPQEKQVNLRFFGGRTIEHLTYTNVYVGGEAAWDPDDVSRIDAALAAAMTDPHLTNVIAQYYADERPTTTFVPSRFLDGPAPHRIYRDTVEGMAASLEQQGILSGLHPASSIVCLLLPRGHVLVDGTKSGHQREHEHHEEHERDEGFEVEHDEAVDSKHGLGGYHGSVHAKHGPSSTMYYAVSVYSEGTSGIPAFDEPWKNVCATLYHELNEARTDPDVEDAVRAGSDPHAERFLGWYSPQGGEIGDIPMEEAGSDLSSVMVEVPVGAAPGTAPIQLMWSNAVGGPEGPIVHKHKPAARS